MAAQPVLRTANRLLQGSSGTERAALLARCESVELTSSQVLCEAGAPVSHVYFPLTAIISLITTLNDGAQLEVGVIGDEGALGAGLVLGATTAAQQALVQNGGTALRFSAESYVRQCRRYPTLRRCCSIYVWVKLRQLALAAACSHFHLIEERLARWLLATRDRAHSNDFHITHEQLAQRLGVRRVGITEAARALHGRGLIEYRRGDMTITDGPGLERASCRCYQSALDMYGQAFGVPQGPQQRH